MVNSQNISLLNRLKNLKRLYFTENEIDDDGFGELFSVPRKLNILELSTEYPYAERTAIGEKGLKALGAQDLSELTVLDLSETPAGDRIVAMGPGLALPRLKTLRFEEGRLSDVGVAYIAREWRVDALETLSLKRCALTDRALESVARLNLSGLREFTVEGSRERLTGEGFLAWPAQSVPQLRLLNVCTAHLFTQTGTSSRPTGSGPWRGSTCPPSRISWPATSPSQMKPSIF